MTRRRENKGCAYEGKEKEKRKEVRNERKIQIRKTRGEEVRKSEARKSKIGKQKMATNRGRPRKMGKAGDKADSKNILDKYS